MKPDILKPHSKSYPSALRKTHTPPKQLYILGELPASKHWVAMVGSRKATSYGLSVARQLAFELAQRGVVIVSGLAQGIDSAAHIGALEAKRPTVAVLGGGFNNLYPSGNRGLARRIIETGGALISEYPPDAPSLRQQFPARNRIIAGLCNATIIVEAALSSGSLITASFALEEGRDVMAVPGNINQPASQGCNQLIKVGAHPVTDINDILHILGIELEAQDRTPQFDDESEEKLYGLISSGLEDIDDLIKRTRLDPPVVSRYLTTLELKGYINPKGGGQWSRRL